VFGGSAEPGATASRWWSYESRSRSGRTRTCCRPCSRTRPRGSALWHGRELSVSYLPAQRPRAPIFLVDFVSGAEERICTVERVSQSISCSKTRPIDSIDPTERPRAGTKQVRQFWIAAPLTSRLCLLQPTMAAVSYAHGDSRLCTWTGRSPPRIAHGAETHATCRSATRSAKS